MSESTTYVGFSLVPSCMCLLCQECDYQRDLKLDAPSCIVCCATFKQSSTFPNPRSIGF